MTNTDIRQIMENVEKAWQYLNPRYKKWFEVSESDEGLCVFVPTKWNKNYEKSKAKFIKEIFKAKDVSFIDIEAEGEPKNFFWSVQLTGKAMKTKRGEE